MALLAVGALMVVSNLSRATEDGPPGLTAVGWVVLLFGWALLTGGLVTIAQRVDGLNRRHGVPDITATDAR